MMAKKLLGDAVKEERLRRNLSQNALAEMVHVSLRTISDIEIAEGYCTRMALDADDQVIGYEFIHLGKFMEMVKKGIDANEALEKAKGSYGRFKEAVKYIDPRNE